MNDKDEVNIIFVTEDGIEITPEEYGRQVAQWQIDRYLAKECKKQLQKDKEDEDNN